ncbi:MAG: Na(+)/H(+) antiporter subunit D [Bacteroidetes bacterium]|nr:Na(+)/H(+) antiporter subunit D [Bacteroidota bacterium]MCW5897027.1 Na(+)/H(+) antiporter subunit D [Bacteroidota bacterium]
MWSDLFTVPALPMLLGAAILPLLPKSLRSTAFLFFPLASLVVVWMLPDGSLVTGKFMQYTLVLCQVDQLSRVFGIIFAFIAFAGGIYSLHINETGQQVAALLYAGCAVGITFAGDLLTLVMFWELMAIASAYLVWARRNADSGRAGMRYLLVHLFGGSLLLAGILLHSADTGSLDIVRLTEHGTIASWLILSGVALNAAVPPLHAWLADAYPRATVTGAVFLSAFTTKSAVYVLARMFPGMEILLIFGVIMTLYGVVFAVLANDIREVLAYHIISQVGYMVAGVGIGTEMALNGAVAHAYSHILYKALLFMGAGVVLHTTGTSKFSGLGGLAKSQPLTLWLFMVGAFSISGFPLFNGFISKSMIVSAAGEAHLDTPMLLLMLASVGTFLSIGLKIPALTWFGADRDIPVTKPPVNMHVGMAVVAMLCFVYGVAPSLLYNMLPYTVTYEPYTAYHLMETVQILLFTFVAFWMLKSKFVSHPTITLDTDWFYRTPAAVIRRLIVDSPGRGFDWVEENVLIGVKYIANRARNPIFFSRNLQAPDADFDPDVYRPPAEVLIALVLLGVVVLFGVIVLL